jgi:hypothetical protein
MPDDSALELSWPQVRAWRLARQHLDRPLPAKRLLDVVHDLIGVQAQVASAAERALAVRLDGLRPGDVDRALWEDRSLIRTWAMRGTLHLLAAAEFGRWIAGTAGFRGANYHSKPWLRMVGMNVDQLEAFRDALSDTLSGEPMTRDELVEVMTAKHGAELAGHIRSGWGTILKPAASRGHLANGPPRARSVTFIRPTDWIGSWASVEPDEAAADLARRYLHTYGPASHADYAAWLGAAQAPARGLFRRLRPELTPVAVEGWKAFVLAEDADAVASTRPTDGVGLVAHFDPYVIGFRPRDPLMGAGLPYSRVSRTAGWISASVLDGGAVVGTWEPRSNGRKATLEVDLADTLKAGDRKRITRAIEGAAERLGPFLGGEPELKIA